MSRLPKKKSRPITVGDVKYRWMFKGRNDYMGDAPLTARVIVQIDAEKPGPVLRALLRSKQLDDPHASDFDGLRSHKASLGPYDVKTLILEGLQQGWTPEGLKQTAFDLAGPVDAGDYEVPSD